MSLRLNIPHVPQHSRMHTSTRQPIGRDSSFAEIAQHRDRIGKKAYLQSISADNKDNSSSSSIPKRSHKNEPMEVSSKRPVPRFREVVKVDRPILRDPRFDHLSGTFNQGLFDQNYGFVYGLRSHEIHKMKEELASTNDPTRSHQLMKAIQVMDNQERARKDESQRQKIKSEWRKSEEARVKLGKKPFFLKQKEYKKLFLLSKLVDKSDGDLDKITERKRKRDAGKDWKRLPKSRRLATED